MSTQIICPDCGGVLGSNEPGVKPCSCFASEPARQEDDTALSDTHPVNEVSKSCVVCGKNVAGHRRFKDSRGYTCVECNTKEVAAEREGKVKCPECRRYIKPAGLVDYKGRLICRTCRESHAAIDGKKPHLVSSKNFEEAEKQNIVRIAIFLGVLLVLMIIGYFKMRAG